ncbi:MAG TPA: hypothetical protein VND41_05345 [Nitrososphaerales archaeon]|nr:hypothetical protein [Nitrososphaerales archaeon]
MNTATDVVVVEVTVCVSVWRTPLPARYPAPRLAITRIAITPTRASLRIAPREGKTGERLFNPAAIEACLQREGTPPSFTL